MASVSKFDFEFGAWTDARGAWDEDDIPDELEAFPLTRLSLGMWKARSHGGLRAVLGRERFVFVVFRRRRAVPTLAARASELVSQQLGRRLQISVPSSPFDLGDASARGAAPVPDGVGTRDATRGAAPVPDGVGARDAPRAPPTTRPGPRRRRRRSPRARRRAERTRRDLAPRSTSCSRTRSRTRTSSGSITSTSVCRRAHRHRGATRHQTGVFHPRGGARVFRRARRRRPASRIRGGERRAFHRAKIRRRSTPSQIRAEV